MSGHQGGKGGGEINHTQSWHKAKETTAPRMLAKYIAISVHVLKEEVFHAGRLRKENIHCHLVSIALK